ncbi:4149_t:CDS:2 [Funneliformis geosporum]|uniref:4149_t:CDS:1 n=1 Tax=Funneliformis geosporum TaxID=1117311 RepID=A0A9W4T1E4_9GLOM|nr:4149_t:CDS:2 [Funneliformis geosporum]
MQYHNRIDTKALAYIQKHEGRSHPRQRRACEKYKAELKKENYHLHSELQTEVNTNHQNESRINQLEKIEHLENALEEKIVELKSEISILKSQLYQAKKDVRAVSKI